MSRREALMAAAQASLQAMYPARLVDRGIRDAADLGDDVLQQGVFLLVATGRGDWTGHLQAEADNSTVRFSVVAYGHVGHQQAKPTLAVEQLEAQLEDELVQWCRASKASPLDVVRPKECQYSGGLEAPVAWIVMELEADYV